MRDKPNPKQQKFIEEYLLDMNATQAAIRAGYSPKTANEQAAQLLAKLSDFIAEAMIARSQKTGWDAARVLTRLGEMAEADICDIVDDHGKFKPLPDWPLAWRRMLQGTDVEEIYETIEGKKEHVGRVVKIKFIDRLKNIELLGKHVNVKAFQQDHNEIHFHLDGVESRLVAARQRADEERVH